MKKKIFNILVITVFISFLCSCFNLGHKHDVTIINGKEATCTADGYTTKSVCMICGEEVVKSYVVPAKGHTEETIAKIEPTCTSNGYTEGKKCKDCGEIIVEPKVIEPKGHTEETIAKIEPTCTSNGYTEGKKCKDCGEVLVAPKTISATGHGKIVEIKAKEPTCTENGYTEGKKCGKCDQYIEKPKTIAALGHTESVLLEGVEATCFSEGYTAKIKCSVCGEVVQEQKKINILEHEYDNNNKCRNCGLKVYLTARELKNDCTVDANNWYYNQDISMVQITLDASVNGFNIIFSNKTKHIEIIGNISETYKNVSFKFDGANDTFLVTKNLLIETSRSIFVVDGRLFLYTIGEKNSFIVTGSAAKGSSGKPATLYEKDGGDGSIGYTCIITPMCSLYTKEGYTYIKGGKGGTGGDGASGGLDTGNGGDGGTGGNVISGDLSLNQHDEKDYLSNIYKGMGIYKLLAGDGGDAGKAGLQGIFAKPGDDGVAGGSGKVASNYQQTGLSS